MRTIRSSKVTKRALRRLISLSAFFFAIVTVMGLNIVSVDEGNVIE